MGGGGLLFRFAGSVALRGGGALLSKTMGCFSGRLMSSASDQKLFCEVLSAFNCSLDEFVGEKGSPRPSPPPSWLFPVFSFFEVALF